mgnify:FL=1
MTQFNFDTDADEGLLDDFDDESAAQADADRKVQAFEREVKQNIATLRSSRNNTDQRVAAAYWLGEAGDPTAVNTLVRVYQETENKQLKQATGYALSQFKALDAALFGGDPELANFARERAKAIIMRGEFGRQIGRAHV